jgi:HAD superfamily hydrolase (TIGR01549 family)
MKHCSEYRAIFFDLDGTLLPLDQSYFVKHYFKNIAAYGSTFGIDPNKLVESVYAGTEVMITNDGKRSNREVFWDRFFEVYGERLEEFEGLMDKFYTEGFRNLREITSENPHAAQIIAAARGAGENKRKVVLATNPVFPMVAQIERLSWIGLSESDFDYITSYENSGLCKPNPEYYVDICRKIGVEPQNCLMLGNDESDDMKGASMAGMDCFLITDRRVMSDNFVWTGERGSFEQALRMMERE